VIAYCPEKALPSTMSSGAVRLVAEKTSSSTMGPAGLDRIWGQVWSAPLSVKTTVLSSGASVLARLPSSDEGPLSVEGELDVARGQRVAVRERQAVLEGDRVRGRVGELGRLGEVGLDVRAAVGRVHEEPEDLVLHRERAVVVRPGRVERGDDVGGADADAVERVVCRVAAGGAAGQDESRGSCSSHDGEDAAVEPGVGCHSGCLFLCVQGPRGRSCGCDSARGVAIGNTQSALGCNR
jgi:hypothetical protein